MRNVEILKQVLHGGQLVKPLPGGGPVLSVEDHTAEHWIATGAAKAAPDSPSATAKTQAPATPAAGAAKKGF